MDSIASDENKNESLKIPPVDLDKMNKDQSLAFNIVMKTLVDFSNESEIDKPLRMIISGSAGSGKSFLIK